MECHPLIFSTKKVFKHDFCSVLDGEMKSILSQGVGSKTKKAEPLTEADEEQLWKKGFLGDIT